MLTWLLTAAVAASPTMPDQGFHVAKTLYAAATAAERPPAQKPPTPITAPDVLYAISYRQPEFNCTKVDMNETFDQIQDGLAVTPEATGRVYGFYDGPVFVFIVTVRNRPIDRSFVDYEDFFVSDRNYCLLNLKKLHSEAVNYAKTKRIGDHPGLQDFTVSAIRSSNRPPLVTRSPPAPASAKAQRP